MINPIAKQEREEKYQEKMVDFIENCRFLIQSTPEHARVRKALYDSYLAEGFTPEQALSLTKG